MAGKLAPMNLQDLPSVNGIQSTTAKIMVELYKSAMGLKEGKELPKEILNRCVALDAKTTKAKNLVTLSSTIPEKQEDLTVYLSRIAEAAKARGSNSAVMSQAYNMYTETVNTLNKRAAQINAQQDGLLQRYRRMVQEQHEAVAELIQQKPKGSITLADIERLLKSFEKEANAYDKDRKNLENDYEKVTKETAKLVEATRATITEGIRPEKP